MELRQLKSFIAVAEELHFRKAAEKIGLAQAVLSAQIKSLEDELGFALFFRTTRHVSLTQAGAVFLDGIRKTLDRLDDAVDAARDAASSGLDRLRIGGIDAALVWFLLPVISNFRSAYPGLHLPLTEITASTKQLNELLRHHVDISFFRPPAKIDGVHWETLFEENVYVAVNAHSALAKQPVISASDLLQERLISYPRHARPYLAHMVHESFDAIDARPNIEFEVQDKFTLLRMVAEGMGVGLVPQWITTMATPKVTFVPYSSATSPLQFGVAWRENDRSETLQAFIEMARDEAKKTIQKFANQTAEQTIVSS